MTAEAGLQQAQRALELLQAGTVQDGFTRIVVSRQVQYVVVAVPDEEALARQSAGAVEEAATLQLAVAGERHRAELAEQALAVLFLRAMREKSSKQMMLNGGREMPDYVVKSMNRLNEPRVILEFLALFAIQIGNLAERD